MHMHFTLYYDNYTSIDYFKSQTLYFNNIVKPKVNFHNSYSECTTHSVRRRGRKDLFIYTLYFNNIVKPKVNFHNSYSECTTHSVRRRGRKDLFIYTLYFNSETKRYLCWFMYTCIYNVVLHSVV